MTRPNLTLERRDQPDETIALGDVGMLTPAIDEDYWEYRVQLTEKQAVVGFPKFTTIGIGFAKEEDWNTNLPYQSSTESIREHIWHNRGDESITKAQVDQAIQMIQTAVIEDRGL